MKVNGKEYSLQEDISLKDFLVKEGFPVDKVAVEKNGLIIKKVCYEEELLHNGDTLEVVSFVGGG